VADIEGRFANHKNLTKLCERLGKPIKVYRDAHASHKVIGFSTFSRVDRGAGAATPVGELARWFDIGMPQAYHRQFGWKPKATVKQMCEAWGGKDGKKGRVDPSYPLWPTGHAYDGVGDTKYIPAREVAEFLEASKGYFSRNLYVWERMTPEQWEVVQLGWASWFSKFGATGSSDERFAAELAFKKARTTEHGWWAGDGIFQTHDDLIAATDQVWLVAPPAWLKQSCFPSRRGHRQARQVVSIVLSDDDS
jgi:hypothetical protein